MNVSLISNLQNIIEHLPFSIPVGSDVNAEMMENNFPMLLIRANEKQSELLLCR